MINLELSPPLQNNYDLLLNVAQDVFRPISRKYDKAEHAVPVELEAFGHMAKGSGNPMNAKQEKFKDNTIRNGSNMMSVLATMALSWGDAALLLSLPGVGLGNAAIAAVATPEQKERFGNVYAAMAITEPGTGSDSANIKTTAVLDGNEWVLNGEKIFITAGDRCNTIVVWATLDKAKGKAAIKSFVVPKGTPGMEVVRLEHKLGIRASDTAAVVLNNCRIPKDNILGSTDIKGDAKAAFGGVMQTFDNTRPVVAATAIGVAQASLDLTKELLAKADIKPAYDKTIFNSSALEAELYRMEADLEASRLLTLKAAWMADNGMPNSKEASMAKAKAGRVGKYIALRCVEICSSLGYSEDYLLEKFARDSIIQDLYEGTQQIQLLIVARRVLGLSSAQLK